jgi:uncharacterized membrane protein YccC
MVVPGFRDWVFSAKTFAGGMLALYLAMYLDLDRPYWALATAYIVSQPLTGAMRSKAAYRFGGTLIGAIATIVLVPNLVDAPELLVAALALWIGGCIYLAVLDRTPRSYLFLLSGYTAALIGFPAVDAPGAVWDTALARVEEISLGIFCTTLIGTLVLPVPLGPALAARIDALLRQAAGASMTLLSGLPDTGLARAGRRRIAADAVEISALSSHLAYDTSRMQGAGPAISVLYQRVILLLAVLSGIADRIAALCDAGALTADLRALLDRMSAWLASPQTIAAAAPGLHEAIAALQPPQSAQADWNDVLRDGLLMRAHELTDIGHDIAALRAHLDAGRAGLPALCLPGTANAPRHRDHFMAAYSGAAAALAVGLVCAFWIATAWPEGAGAAGLTAVISSFFAAQDDPVPSIVKFIYGALAALVIAGVYLFAILPMAHDFTMLALALSPLFLPLGVLMAAPATAGFAGPVAFLTATLLALTSAYSADFPSYANGAAATIVGLAAAAVVLRLVRSVGADWAAQRLLRANRADVAEAASHGGAADRLAFAVLMLDRLGEVIPRIAASADGADAAAGAALAEIRVGINVVDLQRASAACSGLPSQALDRVLRGVAAHFRARAGGPPDGALLDAIDAGIGTCCGAGVPMGRDILLALAGIRRALFRDAPPYRPAPEPGPALEMAA